MYRNRRCNKCGYCNHQKTCVMPITCQNSLNNIPEKCKCGYDEENNGLPTNPELAQSYVPIQEFNNTFCPDTALKMGTLFPELVRPYQPNQSICEIQKIEALNSKGVCNYGCMRNNE